MKATVLLKPFLILAAGIIFHSCQSSDHRSETGDSAAVDYMSVDTAEISRRSMLENGIQTAMFIETVAVDNMMAVIMGKLAEEKANDSGVKSFGKLAIQDHKLMNDKLEALSKEKGLKLPVSLPAKQLQQLRQMREMKPAYFEQLYVKMMIEDHNKGIELFIGAGHSPDTAVSNFARQFLPVLESHRKEILKVREGMKD